MREYSNSICGNESNDSDSSLDITDITIIAGVFFDGTNNNKYNVDFNTMFTTRHSNKSIIKNTFYEPFILSFYFSLLPLLT